MKRLSTALEACPIVAGRYVARMNPAAPDESMSIGEGLHASEAIKSATGDESRAYEPYKPVDTVQRLDSRFYSRYCRNIPITLIDRTRRDSDRERSKREVEASTKGLGPPRWDPFEGQRGKI